MTITIKTIRRFFIGLVTLMGVSMIAAIMLELPDYHTLELFELWKRINVLEVFLVTYVLFSFVVFTICWDH